MHQVFPVRQDVPPHVHVPPSRRADARLHAGQTAQVRRLRKDVQPQRRPGNPRQEVSHTPGMFLGSDLSLFNLNI